MKRTAVVVCVALLGACLPDAPDRQRDGEDDLPAASPVERSAEAKPVRYQIFQQSREEAAPPRETIHLLIQARATRDELRVTLQEVLEDRAAQDSTLVALRAVGYVGLTSGSVREADLTPFAWAEWLPPQGWHDATPESRNQVHRVYFYHGSPPPW